MSGEGRIWARTHVIRVNQRRNVLKAQGGWEEVELTTRSVLHGINLNMTIVLFPILVVSFLTLKSVPFVWQLHIFLWAVLTSGEWWYQDNQRRRIYWGFEEHEIGLLRFSKVIWAPTFRYDVVEKRKMVTYLSWELTSQKRCWKMNLIQNNNYIYNLYIYIFYIIYIFII